MNENILSFGEKKELCRKYWNDLCELLKENHEVVASCNADETCYLIPKGTIDKLSYNGKPVDSYRYSDHWNWYANIAKCADEKHVQCECIDMPRAKARPAYGKPSKPIIGICVAYYGQDHVYHHVFGEKFNRTAKQWSFETDTSATNNKR